MYAWEVDCHLSCLCSHESSFFFRQVDLGLLTGWRGHLKFYSDDLAAKWFLSCDHEIATSN